MEPELQSEAVRRIGEELAIVDVVGDCLGIEDRDGSFFAMCPFHSDSRPSLKVNREDNTWRCDVCDASGDSLAFVMAFHQLNFNDAVQMLTKRLDLA